MTYPHVCIQFRFHICFDRSLGGVGESDVFKKNYNQTKKQFYRRSNSEA
jgi:hypothetical protein